MLNPKQIRVWFAKMNSELATMSLRASEGALLQTHLVANGFPATEMKGLRDALKRVEAELLDLQMAVYTSLDSPPIEI